MKRSEVNGLMRDAEATFAQHGFIAPPWARFSPADWTSRPEQARFCAEHQMGWDVTDFGSGDFAARGLLLLCTRNGVQNRPGERPYAEKIMIVREGQETPFHMHRIKVEDIINRGGGDLVLEVTLFDGDEEKSGARDGADRRRPSPSEPPGTDRSRAGREHHVISGPDASLLRTTGPRYGSRRRGQPVQRRPRRQHLSRAGGPLFHDRGGRGAASSIVVGIDRAACNRDLVTGAPMLAHPPSREMMSSSE